MKHFWKTWWLLILVYVFISWCGRWFYNTSIPRDRHTSLHTDGYVLLRDVFSPSDVVWMRDQMQQAQSDTPPPELKPFLFRHRAFHEALVQATTAEYTFQDYILLIRKSQIHTCHRDYNGDLYHTLDFPSYTMIIYLHDMQSCLDVVEKSHNNKRYLPYSTDPTKHVQCQVGDVLLFNSNLIHAGSLNRQQNNPRIQMKWCHPDDRSTLSFYENYYKLLDDENTHSTAYNEWVKHISCQNPFIFESSPMNTKSAVPSWYTRLVFGNTGFYK